MFDDFFNLETFFGIVFTVFICITLREIRINSGVSLRRYIESNRVFFLFLFFGVFFSLLLFLS